MAPEMASRVRRFILTGVLAAGVGAGATGIALAATHGDASSASTTSSTSTVATTPTPSATHHCQNMGNGAHHGNGGTGGTTAGYTY